MEEIEKYIQMVRKDPDRLYDISKDILIEHPQICMEAVKKNSYAIVDVPREVLLNDQIGHDICIEAVSKRGRAIEKLPKEILSKYPDICMEAVKQNEDTFEFVPVDIMREYPQICIEAVRHDGYALLYVPKDVQNEHLEICMEAVKQVGLALEYVAEDIKIKHPEICIEAVRQNREALLWISENIQNEHPEICMEAVKENGRALEFVSEYVIEKYPEVCIEAVKKYGYALKHVPENIQNEHLEICMEAVKQVGFALEHVAKDIKIKHPEICIEAVRQNLNAYDLLDKEVKKSKLVQEYMFEDVERIKQIKEKANFDIGNEDYEDSQMDIFYHQMIKSIGLDEVEKLVEIPNLSKDEIENHNLEYNEKLNELFERTYKLEGDIGATVEIFRSIDLSQNNIKGKNAKFEVYKNINKILEEENGLTIEEIVREAVKRSGFEIDENVISKLSSKKEKVINGLADFKFEKVKSNLEERLDEGLESQQEPVRRIIEKKIKESIKNGDGRYDVEEVINLVEEELNRKRENGQDYYSHHITSQKEKIKAITQEFLEDAQVENKLSKGLVEVIKEKKQDIGKGWIRKLQGIPVSLSREEYKSLEEELGIKLEGTYEARLKEGKSTEAAYEILSKNSIPGVLTYNQIELMFSKIKEPYSEEFKKYYKENKEEILKRPEVYTEFSKIHNNFDYIINKPEVKNRYEAGDLTLDNVIRILSEQKYDNVKLGNERLAEVSANAGVDPRYFEAAQNVYEITKKREGSALPQVEEKIGKYRGRMLRADDPLNIVIGDITTCCQSLGDVGEGSMMHAATEKNGAIFVIEELDKNGKVIRPVAQSWTWRNKERICYDNIEIKNEALKGMTEQDEKEIMEIYIKAGKKAIETDEIMMSKLLKEGKISQEVYDEVVLKEVTCGTGYNDLGELTRRIESGQLEQTEEIILPKESEKIYEGYAKIKPWIDSNEKQITLARMESEKRSQIEERRTKRKEERESINEVYDVDIPVEYKNARNVVEYKGKQIYPSDVEKIRKIENAVYREPQQILQNCEDAQEVASSYGINEERMELTMSEDGDWYMIGEEEDKEYYIADLAMVGGVNSQRNKEIDADAKIATFEIAEKVYEKMIEMAKKEKNIRYNATRDTSYINTKRSAEKGLIEIIEDKEDKFKNSDIEMNNVVVKPNLENLEEELKKIRKTLEMLKQRGMKKVLSKKREDDKNIKR